MDINGVGLSSRTGRVAENAVNLVSCVNNTYSIHQRIVGLTEYGSLFINNDNISQYATLKSAITQCYVYMGFSLDVESLSTADKTFKDEDMGPLNVAGDLNLESFEEVTRQLPMSPSTVSNEAAGIKVAVGRKGDIR